MLHTTTLPLSLCISVSGGAHDAVYDELRAHDQVGAFSSVFHVHDQSED